MFTTPDGRVVGYDDLGDSSGRPVVYLHGTPDSRLARHPDDELLTTAGVRLLALDRPGYGASSPPADSASARQVHELFAREIEALLDDLGIDQVGLLAWSGGTLQALTSACSLAERVSGLSIVAGVVPREAYHDPAVVAAAPDRAAMLEAADQMPPSDLADMLAPMLAPYPCDQALAAEHQREHRSPDDQATLEAIPGAAEQMAAALAEAVHSGLSGVAADLGAQTYAGSVPPLGDVGVPVQLWYGTDDLVTPAAFGHWYEEHLPDAQVHTVPGAGHAIFFSQWREILASLGLRRH